MTSVLAFQLKTREKRTWFVSNADLELLEQLVISSSVEAIIAGLLHCQMGVISVSPIT